MPTADLKKALKDGLISQKQYDKLPPHLLEAIVKSKRKKGGAKTNKKGPLKTTKKGNARKGQPKGARLAFDDTKGKKGKKDKK